MDGGLDPGILAEDRHARVAFRLRGRPRGTRPPRPVSWGAVGDLDLDGLDRHRLVGRDEAELRLVRGFELGPRGGGVAVPCHRQRGVRARVAQVKARDRACRRGVHALLRHLGVDGFASTAPRAPRMAARLPSPSGSSTSACWRLAETVARADPVGREQARQGMDQHRLHPQGIGDKAGMLPRRAAESVEPGISSRHSRAGR